MLRPFDRQHFDNDNVIEVVMHVTACIQDCCSEEAAELRDSYGY